MKNQRPKRSGTIQRYREKSDTACSCGELGGHYVVRCSAPDGSRPLFHLDPSPRSKQAAARALETAAAISERLWTEGLGAAPKRVSAAQRVRRSAEDCSAWCDAWLADRRRRGIVRDVSSDIRDYVAPATSHKHIRDWTPDDMRQLVLLLDTKVQAGELAWKTATNIWGTATRMCRDACSSKLPALRVRTDNPSAGVQGPDRGVRKSKQFLYPSEFLRFVTCPDVPHVWRVAVACAVYLYPRPAELRGLSLGEDADLERGIVHIHRSLDGDGNAKPTKTKTPRRFAFEPHLLPLLEALAAAGHTSVTMPATQSNLSDVFRRMLKRAGVTRSELHETTATRKAITFYDLRATGITWRAVRGDRPLEIMHDAGHEDFKTTQGYIREADAIRAGFDPVFPPLPDELSRELSQVAQVSETIVRRRGLEPPRELPH